MSFGTTRGSKTPYFVDTENGGLFTFQFAPHELDFDEGGNFSDVIKSGYYNTDMIWISGKVQTFELRVFIDRTQENATIQLNGRDPFADVVKFPNTNPNITGLGLEQLIRSIANGDITGGLPGRANVGQDKAGQLEPSQYAANPNFPVNGNMHGAGIYPDLEQLLYFVRPKGFTLPTMKISPMGVASITDVPQGRFTPPPKCQFFYGSMWKEGYILRVAYNLSVMNGALVPHRLDARVTFGVIRSGYLGDVSADTFGNLPGVTISLLPPTQLPTGQ